MISNKLIQYLESNKLITNIQCEFRKNRSTTHHLIRLDTYIKQEMADGKATEGVFFDLEKSYDSTWRYGILRDMKQLGLRGRMPRYIAEFLRERKFRVVINDAESEWK